MGKKMIKINHIYNEDCIEIMKNLPDSPPTVSATPARDDYWLLQVSIDGAGNEFKITKEMLEKMK
jgi:DNA modification methylase